MVYGGIMNKRIHNVTIASIDAQGNGIASIAGKDVCVPYALPGETCDVVLRKKQGRGRAIADLVRLHTENQQRIAPVCQHFTACGGCHLQHMQVDMYRAFKTGMVADVLSKSLKCQKEQLPEIHFIDIEEATRRRVTFAVKQRRIGFYAYKSHRFIPINACVILTHPLQSMIGAINTLLLHIDVADHIEHIKCLESDNGIALSLYIANNVAIELHDMEYIVGWAKEYGVLAVYTHQGDCDVPLIEEGTLHMQCGDVYMDVAVDMFQQATKQAQDTIIMLMQQYIGMHASIIDLYAGGGTYALALASKGHVKEVVAYEGSQAMVEATKKTIRHHALHSMVTPICQDLYHHPVSHSLLSQRDVVIINPPRNGAGPQIAELAKSTVPCIIMVSCDHISFARDMATLCHSGYVCDAIFLIDQFLYASNLEILSLFYST